jgi:two-component system, chemotaxis family, chemotaxis protein CheY
MLGSHDHLACSYRRLAVHSSVGILIVDDSKTMVEIIARILKDAGYSEINRAYDGVSAMRILLESNCDLVITDWQMEPISGPELIKQIRKTANLSKIRTILITALQGKDDDAWLDGADGYVTKPFNAAALIEKIEEVLSANLSNSALA